MKRILRTASWLSLLGALSATGCLAQKPREAKLVFLRGDELLIAQADGSGVTQLVKDGVPKAAPQWAPDGERIVYRVPGSASKDPMSHGSLVVINPDGRLQKSIPVLATEADGTIVGGMRFIEQSGWHSNDSLFASGSANPYVSEYRIIDATTGRVRESYFGTDFTPCAAQAKVAYATKTHAKSGADTNHIEVNGVVVYTGPSGRAATFQNLRWSNNCDRLAFVESDETSASFVIIRGATVEARTPLRAEMVGEVSVTAVADSFLLQGAGGVTFYDLTTRALRPAPEVVEQLQRAKEERNQLLKRLSASTADWWQPSH